MKHKHKWVEFLAYKTEGITEEEFLKRREDLEVIAKLHKCAICEKEVWVKGKYLTEASFKEN